MSTATVESPQIDLSQVVQIARKYLADAYRDQPPHGVLLEEVELSENNAFWLITLGFDNPHQRSAMDVAMNPLAQLTESIRPRAARIYKTFTIDSKTGRVLSMKIRPV